MSERKAEYYAKHLQQMQEQVESVPEHKHAWDVVADELNARAQGLIDDAGITWDTPIGIPSEPRPVETIQSTGLPTLLAQMVNEFHQGPDLATFNVDEAPLVQDFNRTLLACAQPLLTEHLAKLTNPPMVVKWDDYMLEHPEAYKPVNRDEELLKTLSYRTYLMALPADETALPYREWVATK